MDMKCKIRIQVIRILAGSDMPYFTESPDSSDKMGSWELKNGWYRQSCLYTHVQKQLSEQFMVAVAVLR